MVALSEHTLIVLKVLSLCFLQKENTLLVFKVKFIKVYSLSLSLSLPPYVSVRDRPAAGLNVLQVGPKVGSPGAPQRHG